ncbi:hypothetical protein KAR91_82785 [Candidatus Pacearchaeota archaeon]|nr:hypothetical protein [Candidatus Pacearchaeota archaeon]
MVTRTFSIRLDSEVLKEIRIMAEKEKRNVNLQIVYLLEKGIARVKKESEYLKKMDDSSEEDEILPEVDSIINQEEKTG